MESHIEKPFRFFMDLPLSLRYTVYELLLIRGKIFVSNSVAQNIPSATASTSRPSLSPRGKSVAMPTDGYQSTILPHSRHTYAGHARQRYVDMQAYATPETGVLRGVSKAVQEEAERIFWSAKNLFVFPAGEFRFPTYYHSLSYFPFYDHPKRKLLAKAVSYTFDMRDAGPVDPYFAREHCRFPHRQDGPIPFDRLRPTEQMQRLHDALERQVERVWDDRCFLITRYLQLDRLQLDFEECYCALGCCRKVEYVCSQLRYHAAFTALCYRSPFRHSLLPVFEVMGFRDAAEKEMIRERLAEACRVGRDAFVFIDTVQEGEERGVAIE
jgi:hypothetical protein